MPPPNFCLTSYRQRWSCSSTTISSEAYPFFDSRKQPSPSIRPPSHSAKRVSSFEHIVIAQSIKISLSISVRAVINRQHKVSETATSMLNQARQVDLDFVEIRALVVCGLAVSVTKIFTITERKLLM